MLEFFMEAWEELETSMTRVFLLLIFIVAKMHA